MRKARFLLSLVPFLLAALPGAAELTKHKEWDHSPEFTYLATDDERKVWKGIKDDEEAEKFIALFWQRRDPDLKTPRNEFREIFEARAKKADEVFALGRTPGSLTERGKVLILLGTPTAPVKASRQVSGPAPGSSSEPGGGAFGGQSVTMTYVWTYDKTPDWAGGKPLEVRFIVDESLKSERVSEASAIRKLAKKAAEAALVHPELKEAKSGAQFEAERIAAAKAAAEAAAEAARGAVLSAPVRTLLEGILAKEPSGILAVLPLAYRDGATHLMVQLWVPAPAVPTAQGVKLALLARSKDGKDAARREEPAGLQKSKGDWIVDRGLLVPPGEYDVAVALLDAAGAPLVTAHRSATVAPLGTEFSASPLVLAYNDFPADPGKLDEPFVFSTRKFAVKGDGRMDKTDGFSYALRLYNPSIDPVTRKMALKRTIKIKPKNGLAVEVPQAPDEPAVVPPAPDGKDVVIVDLAGNIVEANLGDYFKPGEFELRLSITDVATGKTVEAKGPFTVVGPPPAPAPPAAAPKKKG